MAHIEPEKYSFFVNFLLSCTYGVKIISFFFFIKIDFHKVTHITVDFEEIYLQCCYIVKRNLSGRTFQ